MTEPRQQPPGALDAMRTEYLNEAGGARGIGVVLVAGSRPVR